MDWGYVLGSVIMMTVLGLSVGNYATSLTYRLPKGLKIANDPPYCDTCRTYLETRDMFPFLSWVINCAKCRFCGAPVPALYAFVELGCAIWFIATWFIFWPQAVDAYLVALALGVFCITSLSLHVAEKRLFPTMLLLIAGLGAVNRVLFDGTVLGLIVSGYLGLMVGVAVWLIHGLITGKRAAFPSYAIMFAIAALCVGKASLLPLMIGSLVIGALLWIVGRRSATIRGSEWIFAITLTLMLLVLFPDIARNPENSSECFGEVMCTGKGCARPVIADCHGPQ